MKPEEQEVGLSKRQSMPDNAGMLFIFPQEVNVPFWMKDTYIALSIAFIAASGEIVEIQDMQPLSETYHQPEKNFLYALEVNLGWFARNGVKAGDRVEFAKPSS